MSFRVSPFHVVVTFFILFALSENFEKEYMPVKSMTEISQFLKHKGLSALSTVFSGQLPIIWFEPVSWLKIRLLPTLAFPAKAIVRCLLFFWLIFFLSEDDEG